MATANTKRTEHKDSADLYSTPEVALEAIKPYLLVDIEDTDDDSIYILEPCAGIGAISEWVMEGLNFSSPKFIYLTDNELYNYGYPTTYKEDFLDEKAPIGEYDIILSNPPYNRAKEFILKGFEHAPIQWHLLRMSFLEGQQRFEDLFSMGKLSDVYIFTYRISCPKGVDKEPSPNSVCYAWFRFDKNYCGQPKLHWLTKANLK